MENDLRKIYSLNFPSSWVITVVLGVVLGMNHVERNRVKNNVSSKISLKSQRTRQINKEHLVGTFEDGPSYKPEIQTHGFMNRVCM